MKHVIPILIIFLSQCFISCNETKIENEKINEFGLIEIDSCKIDTLEYLKNLNLTEEINDYFELIDSDNVPGFEDRIDTIELELYHIACKCPQWIRTDSLEVAQKERRNIFFGYYLSPGTKELILPQNLRAGTKVILIGNVSKKQLYYDEWMDGKMSGDDKEPGYEFRYYQYKILKPYNIWGPKICYWDATDHKTVWMATQLKVE